ncbi:hypothetical protein Ancab_012135 [Ancistrocladus abbreviatus]
MPIYFHVNSTKFKFEERKKFTPFFGALNYRCIREEGSDIREWDSLANISATSLCIISRSELGKSGDPTFRATDEVGLLIVPEFWYIGDFDVEHTGVTVDLHFVPMETPMLQAEKIGIPKNREAMKLKELIKDFAYRIAWALISQ